MPIARILLACAVGIGFLAACSEVELPVEGERLDLRAPLTDDAPLEAPTANRSVPLSLSAQRLNADWTHKAGGPAHRIQHPAFDGRFQLIWVTDIGQGNERRRRLTADPIIAGNVVFTLDSRALVTATRTDGTTLWRRDITPPGENPDSASGGGLAFANGRLLATSSFGVLTALDPATGNTLWTQRLDAAASGAPTAVENQVFLVSSDSRAWAIDARNGRVQWNLPGAPSQFGITGSPSPAVSGAVVVFPFSSGQVVAANKGDGSRLWATTVAGQRIEDVFSRILDIQGDPVIVGDRVYVANSAGRTVALNLANGQREWTLDEGTFGPLWIDGASIFMITDRNELLRVSSATGEVIWRVELPFYVPVRREGRLRDAFVHYGPIIAGNRLIVVSDDNLIRVFNPQSGALQEIVELPVGAARNPVVAGGTLYVTTTDGRLLAFR